MTLSPPRHLFLQMHLSQGWLKPVSFSVLRISNLCSPPFRQESAQALLALAHRLPGCGCSSPAAHMWHSWMCHMLSVSQCFQGLPLALVSTFQEAKNQCPAPNPDTFATPPRASLPPQEAQRGVGNRVGENPPFMSSLGMEIKIGSSLVSKYNTSTVLNSRMG